MDRLEKLNKIFENVDESAKEIVKPLLSKVVFLEKRLLELEKLPFLEISEKNPAHQRQTAASKQYKELMQQYNACIKTLLTAFNKNGSEEESPLREYVKSLKRL